MHREHNGVTLRTLLKLISSNISAAGVSVKFIKKGGSRTRVKYLQKSESRIADVFNIVTYKGR